MILKFQENITEIPKKYRHMVKDFYKTPTGTWMIDLVDGYTTSYGTNYIENKYKKDCLYELMNEVSADKLEEALLYHGSPNKSLTKLEIGKEKTTGDEFGAGIYLTTDYNEAREYSGPDGRVYSVSLNTENLYNLKELLPQNIKEIVKSDLLDNKDIRNQIVRYNRKHYEVTDNKIGFKFYINKKQEWKSLDGTYLGNMPNVNKEGNKIIVTYTDYEDIDSAIEKLTGDDLQKILSHNMDPNVFVKLIIRAGYDGIITHNDNWYIIYKNEDTVKIVESKYKVEEASRNELLALAKMQTKTRYEKAAGYKGFSIVDIDTSMLLRDDTITITCNVGKYYDTIQLMDVLIWIQMESERNPNNQVNTKAITAALMEAIDALEIKVNCTCADFSYRFSYLATQLDYKYGKPENRPADITNPHNYGSMCFTGDTLVLTETGLKPIKDIEVGENVFTHKGRLRPVLDKSNHYEEKLLQAKIGTELINCTENHPFYIFNKNEFNWLNLTEINWANNYACSPKLKLEEQVKLPKGYAFLLGLYLSDGHIDSRKQPNGSLYQNQLTIALDETYKEYYENKIKELGFKYRFREKKYGRDTKCISLQIYDRDLIKFLIEYGGFTYKKDHSKFLNEKCFDWCNEDKLDLINGFFWGDGQFGVTGNKDGYLQYILYNSNKDIMQKLYILIRSFTYARIFSMTKKPFWSKRMNKLITPCEHYLICLRGEHIKDILNEDSYLVKADNSYKHPISSYNKNKVDYNDLTYYLTFIDKKNITTSEGNQVYNLKVAEDESYLITRELYAVHNCKHLISLLSNKKWLQQVTGTIMDWVVKNIDKVNEYLRPKEGMELTLPNELARRNAKLGFYSKLFKDKLEDEPEEEVEDNVDNNNDTDNSNDNNDNVEDDKDNNQNNSNNTNSDNGDDLDDSNINSDEEEEDNG